MRAEYSHHVMCGLCFSPLHVRSLRGCSIARLVIQLEIARPEEALTGPWLHMPCVTVTPGQRGHVQGLHIHPPPPSPHHHHPLCVRVRMVRVCCGVTADTGSTPDNPCHSLQIRLTRNSETTQPQQRPVTRLCSGGPRPWPQGHNSQPLPNIRMLQPQQSLDLTWAICSYVNPVYMVQLLTRYMPLPRHTTLPLMKQMATA